MSVCINTCVHIVKMVIIIAQQIYISMYVLQNMAEGEENSPLYILFELMKMNLVKF